MMAQCRPRPSPPWSAAAAPPGPRVLVLLSARLGHLGVDLAALREWLEETLPGARAQVIADLRRQPTAVAELAEDTAAERLVLGLATGEYVAAPVQAQVVRAQLDPLAVEALDLEVHAASFGNPSALERSKLLLAGAVARARAFAGSRREQLKTSLSVAVSRRALFTLTLREYGAVPALSVERCVAGRGCQWCVRACPQGALRPRDGCIEVDKARCEGCGLCLQVCPAGALELPGYTPAELEARLAALLDPALARVAERGVLFGCRLAMAALEAAARDRPPYPPGWLPVVVPCAGMVSPAWFLRCLAMGALAVGVVPCGRPCPSAQDAAIAERVAFCRELLARMGSDEERVRLCPVGDADQSPWSLPKTASPVGAPSLAPRAGATDQKLAAAALLTLAAACHAPADLALEHPGSPFGVVELHQEACTGCEACATACPTGALCADREGSRLAITFDAALCTACALCLPRCPEADRGALRLRRATDLGALAGGRAVLYEDRLARCTECGARVAPDALLGRVASLMGPGFGRLEPYLSRACSACRSEAPFRPRPAAARPGPPAAGRRRPQDNPDPILLPR